MKRSSLLEYLRKLIIAVVMLGISTDVFGQKVARLFRELNGVGKTIIEVDEFNRTVNNLKARFSKEKVIYFEFEENTLDEVGITIEALQANPKVSGVTTEEAREGLLVLIVNTKTNLELLWAELPVEILQKFYLDRDPETSIHYVVPQEVSLRRSLEEILLNPNGNPSGPSPTSSSNGNGSSSGRVVLEPYMPLPDEMVKACQPSKSSPSIVIGVSPFFIATKIKEPKSYHVERMISYLNTISCFDVIDEPINSVPEGTQAIVTGEIKDYYTSSDAFGRSRIHLEIAIRSASTMEVINTLTIQKEGKVYSGKGFNKQLEELWHECMVELAAFAIANRESLQGLEKVKEEKVLILNTEHSMQQRIETHPGMAGQIRYTESKLEEAHNRNLGLSEYYNDPEVYNSYPKPAYGEFLEYSVGGRKFIFAEVTGYSDETAFLSAENLYGGKDGIAIKCDPVKFSGDMKIVIFDPAFFPSTRRFYFGTQDLVDPKIPGSREKVAVQFMLMDSQATGGSVQKNPGEYEFPIYANNLPGQSDNNVEWGYVQILELETGAFGVIEILFKFKTKEIELPSGFKIAPTIVEGRVRARGNIRPPLR